MHLERNKMKKLITCAFVGFCLFAVSLPVYGSTDDYKTNLKEGFDIILNSPKPMIDSIKEEYNAAEFKPFGVFGGFFKGSFYTLKEFTYGTYRVLTFNVEDDNFFTNMFNKEGNSK